MSQVQRETSVPRPRRMLILFAATTFLLGGIAFAQQSSAAPRTIPLVGRFLNITHPPCASPFGCAAARVTGTLTGTLFVFTESFEFTPDGFASTRSQTTISTRRGDLFCTERAYAVFSADEVSFSDTCRITGGTGMYQGASGVLLYTGTFNLVTGVGEGNYVGGKLVLP